MLIPNTTFVPVRRGRVVGRGLSISKDYTVGYTVNIRGIINGWSNLIRLGTGGNCCGYGQRIPAIFIYHRQTRLHQTDGHLASGAQTCSVEPLLARNRVYNMRYEYRGYTTTVYMNGRFLSNCTRAGRRAFEGVTAYAGDPWHGQPNAVIKGFYVTSNSLNSAIAPSATLIGPMPVQVEPHFIGTLNVPTPAHTFNFDFQPSAASGLTGPQIIWSIVDVSDLSDGVRRAYPQSVTAAYYNYQTSQIMITMNGTTLPASCAIAAALNSNTSVAISFAGPTANSASGYTITANGNPVCSAAMDLVFTTGDSLEVFLGQPAQVTNGMPSNNYARGSISNFAITAVGISEAARNAAVDSAISALSAAVTSLPDMVTNLSANVSTQVNALSTNVMAAQQQLSTNVNNAQQQLSTNVMASQQQLSTNVDAHISTYVSSMRASLASAITTAANNLPSPTTGGSTSSTPNIGVGSSGAFEVDAGNNAMSLKTTCGAIDPCDVARAIAALKNL